jgi:hypothetical protein
MGSKGYYCQPPCWHKEIDDETGICKACGAKAAIHIEGLPAPGARRQSSAADLRPVQDSITQEKEVTQASQPPEAQDWPMGSDEAFKTWWGKLATGQFGYRYDSLSALDISRKAFQAGRTVETGSLAGAATTTSTQRGNLKGKLPTAEQLGAEPFDEGIGKPEDYCDHGLPKASNECELCGPVAPPREEVRALVALREAKEALDQLWAAIGDALCSGKGIDKAYSQSVASQVDCARRRAEAALAATPTQPDADQFEAWWEQHCIQYPNAPHHCWEKQVAFDAWNAATPTQRVQPDGESTK